MCPKQWIAVVAQWWCTVDQAHCSACPALPYQTKDKQLNMYDECCHADALHGGPMLVRARAFPPTDTRTALRTRSLLLSPPQ